MKLPNYIIWIDNELDYRKVILILTSYGYSSVFNHFDSWNMYCRINNETDTIIKGHDKDMFNHHISKEYINITMNDLLKL